MRWRLEQKIFAALAFALVISLLLGVVALLGIRQFLSDARWVTHTHEVLETIASASAAWNDAESARRGYMISAQPDLLDVYDHAVANLTNRLAHLQILTADNTRQQERINRVGSLVQKKTSEMNRSFDLWQQGGDKSLPQQQAITREGSVLSVRFSSLLNEMTVEEENLLITRNERTNRSGRAALLVLLAFCVVAVMNVVGGGIAIMRDVKKRRATEQNLEVLNGELKSFTYTVSHDLKRPLRGIRGYALELERKHQAGLAQRGKFCVEQIVQAVENVDELIEDLLSYSRLTADSATVAPCDLERLVADIIRQLQPAISQAGVTVSTKLKFKRLFCWERGLRQALENVVDNAIKYSRREGGIVIIEGDANDRAWLIKVIDNGIGFDPAHHNRIFDLFRRLVPEEQYTGTGAGLAIARKMIEKQGGRIWAESQPGQGSTFFIELPKREQHEPQR